MYIRAHKYYKSSLPVTENGSIVAASVTSTSKPDKGAKFPGVTQKRQNNRLQGTKQLHRQSVETSIPPSRSQVGGGRLQINL